jgi:hypothetical protein
VETNRSRCGPRCSPLAPASSYDERARELSRTVAAARRRRSQDFCAWVSRPGLESPCTRQGYGNADLVRVQMGAEGTSRRAPSGKEAASCCHPRCRDCQLCPGPEFLLLSEREQQRSTNSRHHRANTNGDGSCEHRDRHIYCLTIPSRCCQGLRGSNRREERHRSRRSRHELSSGSRHLAVSWSRRTAGQRCAGSKPNSCSRLELGCPRSVP